MSADIVFDLNLTSKRGNNFVLTWNGKAITIPVDKCEVFEDQGAFTVPAVLLLEMSK